MQKLKRLMSKKAVIISLVLLFAIMISREVIGLDINLYKSAMSGSFHRSTYSEGAKYAEGHSYDLVILKDEKEIYTAYKRASDEESLVNVVTLEESTYTGNYYLPLIKKFNYTFSSESVIKDGINDPVRYQTGGGEAEFTITGICSIRKAKAIAFEYAILGMIEK